ncbi:MAG: hypothetical protein D6744_01550, partial [Planctomycetota bacterium]
MAVTSHRVASNGGVALEDRETVPARGRDVTADVGVDPHDDGRRWFELPVQCGEAVRRRLAAELKRSLENQRRIAERCRGVLMPRRIAVDENAVGYVHAAAEGVAAALGADSQRVDPRDVAWVARGALRALSG